ncbi:MAG: acyltransferase, partial [Parvularculaceae bacterium]|nr:acyltransferase [Parvularculaceae bacterium]
LALLPCISTAALILSRDALPNRLLSARPAARIGDMSYSLYLWHWPILVFARFLFPSSIAATVIAILLSFAAAAATWTSVERPFLEGRVRRVFPLAATATVLSLALCASIYFSAGAPQRFPREAQAFLQGSDDFNKDRYKCHMRSDRPVDYENACIYGATSVAPTFAVWGDSHGAELAKVLGEKLAPRGAALRSLTMSGCPATLSRGPVCRNHNIAMLAAIKNDKAMRVVILTSNLHGTDRFARESVEGVKATALELLKAGKQVVLVYPIPTHDFDPPSMLAIAARRGDDVDKVGMARARYEEKSGWIVADFVRFTKANGVLGVDPADTLCDATACRVFRANIGVLYYNQGHLSLTGAGLIADRILAALHRGL